MRETLGRLLHRYQSALSPLRFSKSLKHALRGIKRLFATEPNALIHSLFVVVVPLVAWLKGVTSTEWMLLLLCIGLVLSAEAVNTAIEKIADKVSPEYSPLIKDAKDMAAAAVLFISIASAIVGSIILLF